MLGKFSLLIVGAVPACTTASRSITESRLLEGVRLLARHDAAAALSVLDEDETVAVTLVIAGEDSADNVVGLVAEIQKRQRNPLMAVMVRSASALPADVEGQLWDCGVADRQYLQSPHGPELAASLAAVLREHARLRAHSAIAESSTRVDKAKSFGELARLALQILDEQRIGRRGAMFCFQRNIAEPELLAVTGSGIYASMDCTPVGGIDDPGARDIIGRAWERRASLFEDDRAALYIGTPTQAHPALIVLALERPLLPWQKGLLVAYANALAPAVEECQLTQQLIRTQRAMISTLATLAEYKDANTGEHVARVARITAEIASYLAQTEGGVGGDPSFLEHIGHASILHDLGKVAIPEQVLLKAGPLDDGERKIINTHVIIGHEMLKKAAALASHGEAKLFHLAAEIARSHHERYDGKGYPDGLRGEEIPLAARIVAVVDVFDALISRRPYKEPWSVGRAIDLLRQEAGCHFDPRVVEAFIAVHERKATATLIQWSPAMSVGHDELDRDHQRLIGILNSLGISAELGNRSAVEFILDDLADYTQVHFRREEGHLEGLDFPELDRHRTIHDKISRHIENAKWKYLQGISPLLEDDLLKFLSTWLNDHILVEDMKYSAYR